MYLSGILEEIFDFINSDNGIGISIPWGNAILH